MPGILSYTPPWLSRPSPGSEIFSASAAPTSTFSPSKTLLTSHSHTNGVVGEPNQHPRRVLAHRGTQIFVVVDNKLRWADLADVKDGWEASTGLMERSDHDFRSKGKGTNAKATPFRVGYRGERAVNMANCCRFSLFRSTNRYDS